MNKQKTFAETPSHTDTSIITASDAALRFIASMHGAEVPLEPFSAAVTAQALASALHPYKTPHGREADSKMVMAISITQQQAEPVAWQFYENGRWWSGDDRTKDHRKHTEDAGIPTRDLYAQPPAQPVARDVLMAAMNDVRRAQLKIVREGLQGGRWIEDIDDAVSGINLDSIADRHATALTVEMHSTDLNDRKAAEIIQAQDFTATGYVLTGQDGRYALCNGGAVRWLDKAEYQRTMFPGVEHSPVPVAYLKTAAGVMQLSFEGNPVVAVGADIEVQADTVQPLFAQPPAQQQAQPRCACGDGFTSEAVCANCLAAQPQAEPVALIMCDGKSYDFMVTVEGQKRIPDTGEFVHLYATQPPAVAGDAAKDAARYRLLRHGRHWSVIDGIGDELRGEALDAAIDAAAPQAQWEREQGPQHGKRDQ